ncbi:MAG: hypothetical protein Q9179_007084 [Wetmoreana sp. 5 TL-2023]
MRVTKALTVSFLLPCALAGSFRVANVRHDGLGKRTDEPRDVPYPSSTSSISTTSTTSTIGYLPNAGLLGTGTPANGGVSLTGHGPAVQPQPGSSSGNGNDTGSGGNTSSGNYSSSNTTEGSSALQFSEKQYTHNGHQRIEISIKYGMSHIRHIWEVHDGMLTEVPIPHPMPTTTPSMPCMPVGTGTSSGSSGANDTNAPYGDGGSDSWGGIHTGSSGTGAIYGGSTGVSAPGLPPAPTTNPVTYPASTMMGEMIVAGVGSASGTPVPMQLDRPDISHPGFTGPRLKLKRYEGKKERAVDVLNLGQGGMI